MATDGPVSVVVEVRTITGTLDPIDAIGERKRRQVRRLAHQLKADRVDFLGIRLDEFGMDFHWVQD